MSKGERVKLCLSIPWHIPQKKVENLAQSGESFIDTVNSTRATVMVGDQFYHDIWFPVDELARGYLSLSNKPVKLNHTDDIEYEIGYGRDPQFSDGKITIQPVIVPETKHASTALGWMKCRYDAGQVPEVSVEVWVDRKQEIVGDREVTVARDLEFDGFALVSRGACSPESGCGIGMSTFSADTDTNIWIDPYLSSSNGDYYAGTTSIYPAWIPLENIDKELEAKWDTTYINSLPNMAFAAVESCANEKKSARHLPHHTSAVKSASEHSSVDIPHLRNALARVNQIKAVCDGTDINRLKSKALKHLINHAKALGVGEYERYSKLLKSLEEQRKMTKKKVEEQIGPEEDEEEPEEETPEEEVDEFKLALEKEIEELKNKQEGCAKLNKELVLERDSLKASLDEKTGELETLTERIGALEKELEELRKPRQKGLNSDGNRDPEQSYYEAMREKMRKLRRN